MGYYYTSLSRSFLACLPSFLSAPLAWKLSREELSWDRSGWLSARFSSTQEVSAFLLQLFIGDGSAGEALPNDP